MTIPRLNDVIKALDCKEWRPSVCKSCIYGFLDDSGDNPIWTCKEEKVKEDASFWLKIYQHLIEEDMLE